MELTVFDKYNLRARICVILFYTIPFAFDVFVFFKNRLTAIEGLALTVLLFVFAQCTLHLCRRKNDSINNLNYTANLLMPQSKLSETTRKRYYRKLASHEPEFRIFEKKEHDVNTEITLEFCESVVTWLKAKTRDRKTFHMVYEENINYGFTRNMLSMKKLGIIINTIAIIFLTIILVFPIINNLKPTDFILVLEIMVHIGLTAYLIFAITKEKVEASAKRYANALLETIDILD